MSALLCLGVWFGWIERLLISCVNVRQVLSAAPAPELVADCAIPHLAITKLRNRLRFATVWALANWLVAVITRGLNFKLVGSVTLVLLLGKGKGDGALHPNARA